MKNVSSAFREELKKDNRNYIKSADITLKNGTVLEIDNSDLWQNGMKLDTATSSSNSFDLGAIITGQLTLTLNNIDEKFSDYDFTDCTATNVKVGLKLPDGTTESLSYGKFYLNEAKYNGSIITLTFYDSIHKFDQPYSKSSLSYPATLRQIVQDACSVCGVTQGTFTFDQDDFVVQERPDDSSITFRQVLQWVGQIACYYFYADSQGRLSMKWYDLSAFEDADNIFLEDSDGNFVLDTQEDKIFTFVENGVIYPGTTMPHHNLASFVSLNTGLDDVVITGIKVIQEVDGESGGKEEISYQSGNDGYVLAVSKNKLIQGDSGNTIASLLGTKIIGMRFRTFSASGLSDPTIEAGDPVVLIDRKGNSYQSYITNNVFQPGAYQSTSLGAETPARKSATRYSQISQVYVDYRKELQKERDEREQALDELGEQIKGSGGLFTTIETQADGSKKYFMHNKPVLSESDIIWSMTAEAWGVSTDGGKTYNAGMTVDGDTIVRILTAVGINADWINAGALTIEKDGQVMFRADVDTGQVDIVANSFSLRGQTIDEIAQGEVNEFVNGVYAPTLNEIQNQIDQKTETWYQPTDPSLQWTETEESALQDTAGADILDTNGEQIIGVLKIGKTVHEGDLWKDSDTNVEYIYQDGQWIEMPIPDAVFDEIDGKARIFVTTPIPPYSERDLWMQGPDGDIMTCVHGRESGSFVSSDWEVKQKYTDDTAAIELDESLNQEGVFNRLTNNGEVQGLFLINGQLYVNASYINSGIFAVSKPGGTQTFYANAETGVVRIIADEFSLTNGDTIDSIAEDYANSAYENSVQYTEQQLQDYEPNLTQESVFNALTNNGQAQGIFIRNGQLYINMSYAQSGTLKLGGSNNVNGLLQVYNSSGVLVGTIDNVGAKFTNGNDWLQISQSLLTGGYGSTTDGVLDLSANYGDGSRNVVLESKTGDVILKSSNEFLVQRQDDTIGYLIQSGGTDYFGDPVIEFGDTYPIIGIMYGEDEGDGSSYLDIRLANGKQATVGRIPSSFLALTVTGTAEFYKAPKLYNLSHVTSGGHLVFASDGATVAYLSSSSKRYKNHVSDVSDEEALKILDIPVIKFKYKDGYLFPTDFLVDKEIPGFYAEDVEEVNPILCQYNEDGSVEDWNYRTMIPYMLKTMQIQQKRIDDLQSQIEELKTMILNMKGA